MNVKGRSLLTVGVMVTALAGCTSGATPGVDEEESFVELAEERLGGLAGVDEIAVTQYPRDPSADITSLDGLDATLWGVEVTVSMADTATTELEREAAWSRPLDDPYR